MPAPELSLERKLVLEAARRHAMVLPSDQAREKLSDCLGQILEQQHLLELSMMRICSLELRLRQLGEL